jgi:EpsI family protein
VTPWQRLLVAGGFVLLTAGALRVGASTELAIPAPRLLDLDVPRATVVDDARLDEDTESVLQADQYLMRTYVRADLPITLFVAYYATQRSGHTIHSPLNCLPGTGWTWMGRSRERVAITPTQSIEVNRNVATKGGEVLLLYYWYQSHGRVVASDYRNKLLLVQDSLLLHRSDGALVRVTVPATDDEQAAKAATAFIRDAYPSLTKQLPE